MSFNVHGSKTSYCNCYLNPVRIFAINRQGWTPHRVTRFQNVSWSWTDTQRSLKRKMNQEKQVGHILMFLQDYFMWILNLLTDVVGIQFLNTYLLDSFQLVGCRTLENEAAVLLCYFRNLNYMRQTGYHITHISY